MKRSLSMAVILLGMQGALMAGTFVCDAVCLSKVASASSIALNADKAVSGSKKAVAVLKDPFHPRRALAKLKKAKKT